MVEHHFVNLSPVEIVPHTAWLTLPSGTLSLHVCGYLRFIDGGVPPTDLTRRGKDDRALAVYFIFGASADRAKGAMALLSSRSARTLVYVFGGDRPRGSMLPSPHMGERGKFIVLRAADAPQRQWLNESVDLVSDHVRAFGQKPSLLLAVAISSDSDDTRGRNRARLRDLRMA